MGMIHVVMILLAVYRIQMRVSHILENIPNVIVKRFFVNGCDSQYSRNIFSSFLSIATLVQLTFYSSVAFEISSTIYVDNDETKVNNV